MVLVGGEGGDGAGVLHTDEGNIRRSECELIHFEAGAGGLGPAGRGGGGLKRSAVP